MLLSIFTVQFGVAQKASLVLPEFLDFIAMTRATGPYMDPLHLADREVVFSR